LLDSGPFICAERVHDDMTGDLQTVMNGMSEFVRSVSRSGPDDVALMKGHLRISRDDLAAAKVLYKKHLYSSAVYHLQQSVEKATKAFCIGTGLVSASEAKSIGHNPLEGHFLYASRLSSFIPELGKIDPRCNVDLAKIGEVEEKGLEIARLDRNAINSLLASYDAVDKSMDYMLSQVANWVNSQTTRASKGQAASKRPYSGDDVGRTIAQRIQLSRNIPFLFLASALTFPHEEFTRYPDGKIKPWDYGKSMGIIACMPELIRRMDKTLRALESMPK